MLARKAGGCWGKKWQSQPQNIAICELVIIREGGRLSADSESFHL